MHQLDSDAELVETDLATYASPYVLGTASHLSIPELQHLQRLRLAHGIYFYPSAKGCPDGAGRAFPSVLQIALDIINAGAGKFMELTLDVDVAEPSFAVEVRDDRVGMDFLRRLITAEEGQKLERTFLLSVGGVETRKRFRRWLNVVASSTGGSSGWVVANNTVVS